MSYIQENILPQNPHQLSICTTFNEEISLYLADDRYNFQTDGLERWQWIEDITGSVPVGEFTVQAKLTWRLIQYLASISVLKLPQKPSKPPLEVLMESNFKYLYTSETKSYFKLGGVQMTDNCLLWKLYKSIGWLRHLDNNCTNCI